MTGNNHNFPEGSRPRRLAPQTGGLEVPVAAAQRGRALSGIASQYALDF